MARKGTLLQITLKNFQTYKNATFSFNPSLNFIAAPNGTGKSTITNAIAFLCLGTPKTLNKNCDLNQYIKFGETFAIITGVFQDPSPQNENATVTLTREIRQGKSGFFINNIQIKKNIYQEKLNSFNIDVNNMTQFLPQEKVSEFARLSPENLLNEVIKTTDSRDYIIKQREQIICTEKEIKEINIKLNSLQSVKEGTEKIVGNLKEEVEKMNERIEKEKLIKLLLLKVDYLDYNASVKSIGELDDQIKYLIKNIEELQKVIVALNFELKKVEEDNDYVKYEESLKLLSINNGKITEVNRKLNEYLQKKEFLKADLNFIEKNRKKRQVEREQLKEKKIEFENKIKNIEEINMNDFDRNFKEKLKQEFLFGGKDSYVNDDSEEENSHNNKYRPTQNNMNEMISLFNGASSGLTILEKLIDERKNKQMQYSIIKREKNEEGRRINEEFESLQKRKSNLTEIERKKLEMLKKYNYQAFQAVQWLRNNENQFKEKVLEPSFLHIKIKDARFTKEVESLINHNMLVSFICLNDDDFSTFTRKVKDEMGFKVNVVKYSPYHYDNHKIDIKTIGFDGYCIDFIEGRKEYLDLFCLLGNINKIPIAKNKLDENMLFKKYDFKRMIINGRFLGIIKSRYNSNDSVTVDSEIKSKGIFDSEGTEKELKEIEDRINEIKKLRDALSEQNKTFLNKFTNLREDIKKMEERKLEHITKGREICEYKKMKERIKEKIKMIEDQIKNYNEQDLDDEKANVYTKIESIEQQINTYLVEVEKTLKDQEFYTIYKTIFDLEKTIEINVKEKARIKNNILEHERNIEYANKRISALNEEIDTAKSTRSELKKRIKTQSNKICNISSVDVENLEKNFIFKELENLPQNKIDLNNEINRLKIELNFITCDQKAIIEYQQKCKSLKDINLEKEYLENDLRNKENDNITIRNEIIQYINKLIAPVNEKFEYFFKKLNCEGKIEFEHKTLDCDKWKINILVKFRKDDGENFNKLSASRQSGGEKSVSTILFLLAIQYLSNSPFKLVDEINQGMDRYNEKMMSDLLIELTEEPDAPQFFIITPKIVQGINFGSKMKIIIIYQGKGENLQSGYNSYKSNVMFQ